MQLPLKQPALASSEDFPKTPQRSTNPKQAGLTSVWPVPLAKWPQASDSGNQSQLAQRLSKLWSVLAWKVVSIKWPQAWHMGQLASAHIVVPTENRRPALAAAGLSSLKCLQAQHTRQTT